MKPCSESILPIFNRLRKVVSLAAGAVAVGYRKKYQQLSLMKCDMQDTVTKHVNMLLPLFDVFSIACVRNRVTNIRSPVTNGRALIYGAKNYMRCHYIRPQFDMFDMSLKNLGFLGF